MLELMQAKLQRQAQKTRRGAGWERGRWGGFSLGEFACIPIIHGLPLGGHMRRIRRAVYVWRPQTTVRALKKIRIRFLPKARAVTAITGTHV